MEQPWYVSLAQILGGFSAVVLALYAWLQHKRDEDRKRRQETPLLAVSVNGDLAHAIQVKLANLSAGPVWVVDQAVDGFPSPGQLNVQTGPNLYGGKEGVLPTGTTVIMLFALPQDPYSGQLANPHAEVPDAPVLHVAALYGPTGQKIHQFKWKCRAHEDGIRVEQLSST